MCMTVTVDAPGADLAVLRGLSDALEGPIAPFTLVGRIRPRSELRAHGCDLLSDDADWDAATWSMTPDAISELAAAFRTIFASVREEVRITAIWSDDDVDSEAVVTRTELLELTRRGSLETRTRYRVLGDP